METKTASEIMDIMEELGICVDSFTDDIYIPTLEEYVECLELIA